MKTAELIIFPLNRQGNASCQAAEADRGFVYNFNKSKTASASYKIKTQFSSKFSLRPTSYN